MAIDVTVTKVEVIATTGANKQPYSGYATFSDGKYYSFTWHPIEQRWVFFTRMKQTVGTVQKLFYSKPREAAMVKYFA